MLTELLLVLIPARVPPDAGERVIGVRWNLRRWKESELIYLFLQLDEKLLILILSCWRKLFCVVHLLDPAEKKAY